MTNKNAEGKSQEELNKEFEDKCKPSPDDTTNCSMEKITYTWKDGSEHTETKFNIPSSGKGDLDKKEQSSKITRSLFSEQIMKGDASDAIKRVISSIYNIKIDWTKILRDSIHAAFEPSTDLTWSRPRKSMMAFEDESICDLPDSDVEERYGTVVFMLDESGSMDDAQIAKAANIVNQSKEYYKNIWMMKHDSVVTWEKTTDTIDMNDLITRRASGGTSHRDCFEKIKKFIDDNQDDNMISVIIGVTDLCSDIEDCQQILEGYNLPIIWLTEKGNAKHHPEIDSKIIEID